MGVCIQFQIDSIARAGEEGAEPLAIQVADAFHELGEWLIAKVPDVDDDLLLGGGLYLDGFFSASGDMTIDGDLLVVGDFSCSGTKSAILDFADGKKRLLYCVEAPACVLEDDMVLELDGGLRSFSCGLDPLFVECCEPGSIHVASLVTSMPAVNGVGARVEGGALLLDLGAGLVFDTVFHVGFAGTRRGHTQRFPEAG